MAMTQWVKWLYLLTLAVWIGSIVFFSFAVAPTVFKTLKPEDAATLIRRIFSKYYLIGIACAAVGIVCVGLLLADRSFGKWPAILTLLLLAGMGGTDLWLRQGVMPHMNHLRDQRAAVESSGKPPDEELEREWKALHRLSVQLNGAVLFCGLVLVFLIVYARVV
jgi:uncharacterized membrane protein